MEKIIHYCWFGGKPLPKLAKKCLKSWKKYFPDYKIMLWNESNFDVNITEFSKEAYKNNNWAFVSDVARIYALKEYGGIYFDTDMIVQKNVEEIISDCEAFAGWESEFAVAVGAFGAKKNHPLINKLWKFYSENEYSNENMSALAIPVLLTNILKLEYGLKSDHMHTQILDDKIKIFARDYFYPISCDDTPNMFTDRTCMVHYYVGSWIDKSTKLRIKFQTTFGKNLGNGLLDFLVACKRTLRKIAKLVLYPFVVYRRKKNALKFLQEEIDDVSAELSRVKKSDYLVFYNKNWLGTKNATVELFDNTVGINELHDERVMKVIVEYIEKNDIKLVVFSAFAYGWDVLAVMLREKIPNIVIKVIWHGSHAMNIEYYDWDMYQTLFSLLDSKTLNAIAFAKKSMYEFYKLKGYNVELVLNTVHLEEFEIPERENDEFTKIGIYASGDRWVKNFYNQLAAASLFENAKIDVIPSNWKTQRFAKIMDTTISGLASPISREKLLARMAKNDINFYVTFSECAPMIPLESLEMGIPCITSHNHHYWEGTELEEYLVVDENDNTVKIFEKAKLCLENKDKIIKLYKKWKKAYDKEVEKCIEEFLKIDK